MVVFKMHFPQLRSNAALFLTFNNPFSRPSKFNILQVQYVYVT